MQAHSTSVFMSLCCDSERNSDASSAHPAGTKSYLLRTNVSSFLFVVLETNFP